MKKSKKLIAPPPPVFTDPLEPVALTDGQEDAWETSKALLLTAAPGFAQGLYELLSFGEHLALFTLGVPIAATDGRALMLNPGTFFAYDPGERLFVMSHEILHCLLEHPFLMQEFVRRSHVPYPDGTLLPYFHELGNMAADYVVNAILVEGRVGKYNKNWLYDTAIATSADSFADTYRKLFTRCAASGMLLAAAQPAGGGAGQPDPSALSQPLPGAAAGQSGFDLHLPPGTVEKISPSQARAEASGPKHRRVIEQALDTARTQGQLPDCIERALKKSIEPQVDWTERLGTTVSRRIGNDRYNWEVADQEWASRDIYVPSRASFGCADLVCGADVSGSVSDAEVALFFGCMVGILEQLRPRRLFVVWCDAKVQRVDEVSSPAELYALPGPTGGGGTSFVPVFEWVAREQLEIDGLIYLTDGHGTHALQAPRYPVVWGNLTPGKVYPFGEVIDIPRTGKARGRY